MARMVHTFSALGCRIAVDVSSGAVHILDELTYDLLRRAEGPLEGERCPAEIAAELSRYPREELDEAWRELLALQEAGELFADDDYVDPARAVPQNAPVKALCLHVAHDCNLRCKYCFASTGDFGTGRKIMDFETAKKAIDFVVARSGGRRNIEVDFFGGEPLMAMDTVRRTVDYARGLEVEKGKHFRFTITTNGVLLDDENIAYINREMDNVVLSLDGRKEVNDRMRRSAGDTGSYDRIVPRFQKLVAGRGDKDYYVRGTYTHYNTDFAEDVAHMADLGFEQISVEPVVGEASDEYTLTPEDLTRAEKEYDRLVALMEKRGDFHFFHFNVDLAQGPCVIKRMRGCGAGCEYVAVTPEGDIYPCHQFVGNPEYRMGSVHDGSFNFGISDVFAGLNIYSREDCRNCWARFYCSGGCSASNLQANGDIRKPYAAGCDLERKRLECAIARKALAAQREAEKEERRAGQ